MGGCQMCPVMPPIMGTSGGVTGGILHPCDTPMLFFDNLVKKLDNLSL